MKVHFKLPNRLNTFYKNELRLAQITFNKSDLTTSWRHLERAHIIAQPYPIEHKAVHWKMLLFSIKIKSTKEVLGQIPRLLVGGVKSFVGVIPVGNTGGANVPPLKSMEIPQDLRVIIDGVN